MPTYQYRCTECGHDLEVVQKFTDATLTECPNCRGQLRKIFNAVGVVFKGSGFYRTDSRAQGSESSEGSTKVEAGDKDSGNKDSGSKDSGSKDPGTKGSGTKDSGSNGSGDKGSGKESGSSAPVKADTGSGSGGSTPSGRQPAGSGAPSTGQKSSST